MNLEWKYGKLNDAVNKASSNISLNKIQKESGDYPVFGAKGFVKSVSFFQQQSEYLAIIKDGAGIGRVSKHPAQSSVLATMQYIIPKEEYDIDFVRYFLESLDFEEYRTGSTIPHIYFKDYKNAKFPLVGYNEQKQIVAILDEAFEAIDRAKANIEKNILNAKELFQSKLDSIFLQKGKNWEVKKLGEIASVEYGYTDKSTSEGDFRYVRITDIDNNGKLISNDKKYIKHSKEAEKFVVKDKDLLMARTGATFAKVLLYDDLEPSVFASYLIRINFQEKIENELYWYFSKSGYYWQQANELSSGAAQPHFNGAALKQILFPYPKSKKAQKELLITFQGFLTQTQQIENIYYKKIASLDKLKKSILQKAFAGELTSTVSGTSFTDKTEPFSSHLFEKIDGISPTDLQAGLTAIALNKHLESETAHTFHHVKAEKIIHLAEYALSIDLERNPVKDAAGPNDFKHSKKIESRAKKAGFYTVSKHGDVYEYSLGTQAQKLIDKATTALGDRFSEFNKLLELFVTMNTQQAEIVATVYAAWNNLLIQGKPTTDEAIVLEARENWHKNKLKIDRDKFFKAIDWMKKYEILIPKGNGKVVYSKKNG